MKNSERDSAKNTYNEQVVSTDDLEHVLSLPQMYVGDTELVSTLAWIYDEEQGKMVQEQIEYSPACLKIIDEALVNAYDVAIKTRKDNAEHLVTFIKVSVDKGSGEICIHNNGMGVPLNFAVDNKGKEKKFKFSYENDPEAEEEPKTCAEIAFSDFKSSSNYDSKDSTIKQKKRITGGCHGFGIKLTNALSKKFQLETVDSRVGKKFNQRFADNLHKRWKPKIVDYKSAPFTKVTFTPDWKFFNLPDPETDATLMDAITDGMYKMIVKRVYDLTACTPDDVSIYLNGRVLKPKTFVQYVNLYVGNQQETKRVLFSLPNTIGTHTKDAAENTELIPSWEVCVCFNESGDKMEQISFVNGVTTIKGGKHVDYISGKIVDKICQNLQKKNKDIKPGFVKPFLWIFLRSTIINPRFLSQTKEALITTPKDFGFSCEIPDDVIPRILKLGIRDAVLNYTNFKSEKAVQKNDGKKTRTVDVPKLEDAPEAGGRNSDKCILIITEGDSAKTSALAGRSGLTEGERKYFGVWPIRGKFINVRDKSDAEINKNAEVNDLKKILGLKSGVKYTDFKQLRYGAVMIMTDQDVDGFHIKCLLLNFFERFWPELLTIPGFFFRFFITPLAKATLGKQTRYFFNEIDYRNFRHENPKWEPKYYKGLGTSTKQEMQEYFSEFVKYQIKVSIGEACTNAIDLAFNKKRANDRKDWLGNYSIFHNPVIDFGVSKEVTANDLIHRELILFGIQACIRSIPNIIDGQKEAQRKVLFACFKRNLIKEIKVSQLAGYVSEHSSYHHGEESLNGTIINLAQNFVGSNNMNMLYPSGQFGTRLKNGADHASPRYIFTRLQPITRLLMPPTDIYTYMEDDGNIIEPKYYVPIIPILLANGCSGIGTGWSTFIPSFNPLDIIDNMRATIRGQMRAEMTPYYRGFKGTFTPSTKEPSARVSRTSVSNGGTYCPGYTCRGVYTIDREDGCVHITEIPIIVGGNIGRSFDKYKEDLLERMKPIEADSKRKPLKYMPTEVEFDNDDIDMNVRAYFPKSVLDEIEADPTEFIAEYGLESELSMNNMVVFNNEGKICRITIDEIFEQLLPVRLDMYRVRRDHRLRTLEQIVTKLENKHRFINEYLEGIIKIGKQTRDAIEKQLISRGYYANEKPVKETDKGDMPDKKSKKDKSKYGYLLNMQLWSLTKEKMAEFSAQLEKEKAELEHLKALTPKKMWLNELDILREQVILDNKEWEQTINSQKNNAKKLAKTGAKVVKRATTSSRKSVNTRVSGDGESPNRSSLVGASKFASNPAVKKTVSKRVTKKIVQVK